MNPLSLLSGGGSGSSNTTLPGYTAKSTTKIGNTTLSYSTPTTTSTYNIITGQGASLTSNPNVSPSGGTLAPTETPSATSTEGGLGGVTTGSTGFSLSNPLDLALIGAALVVLFLLFRNK